MGSVQQAVLDFDREVRAPWRPRLVTAADAAPVVVRHPSRRAPSRVAVCEPRPARSVSRRGPGDDGSVGIARPRTLQPPRRRPAPSGRTAPVRLRLTVRARRLAVVLALGCGVALGSWIDSVVGGGAELRLAGESTVVVQSGDTLWSIAGSVAGDDDVRAVIEQIRQVNGLSGSALEPGQVLQLP